MKKPSSGDEALAVHEAIKRRVAAERAEHLAEWRARAVARGKEPFGLEKFETIYILSERRKQKEGTVEERRAVREYDYYVLFEEVMMTIEEYAKEVWRVREYWDGLTSSGKSHGCGSTPVTRSRATIRERPPSCCVSSSPDRAGRAPRAAGASTRSGRGR